MDSLPSITKEKGRVVIGVGQEQETQEKLLMILSIMIYH